MRELKLKTETIVEASKILEKAKYHKLGDQDAVRLWRISRVLNPIAKKYLEDSEDAQKKFLPSEDFPQKISKALTYQKMTDQGIKEGLPLTTEEYQEIAREFGKYDKLVKDALKELRKKEEQIEIETLSDDAFGKLMCSNDWKLSEVEKLEFIVG